MSRVFRTLQPIVLASASPRRKEFLQDMGLTFSCVRPGGLEPQPLPGEDPAHYAQRAADSKSLAVARLYPGQLVIGADTVVAPQEGPLTVFGKPADAAEALHMLKALNGRSHNVISALCVVLPEPCLEPCPLPLPADQPAPQAQPKGTPEQSIVRLHRTTQVNFHHWPEAVLAAYVATGEPMDKAGAYAIQGQGAFLVESIHGSWSSVVGLPLAELMDILVRAKVIAQL